MWIDERGSDVLDVQECRRLLAVGAKEARHGHLGISQGAGQPPIVLPVDYAMDGVDVVMQVGEGLFGHVVGQLVSFQVDGTTTSRFVGTDPERPWSVLVQGLATEQDVPSVHGHVPVTRVAHPGRRLVRIRSEVITGRRITPAPGSRSQRRS